MSHYHHLIRLILVIASGIFVVASYSQCTTPEVEWHLDFDADGYGTSTKFNECALPGATPAISDEARNSLLLPGNAVYVNSTAMPGADACPWNATKTISVGSCGCAVNLEGGSEPDSDADGDPDCTDPCPNDSNRYSGSIFSCACGDSWPENDSDADGIPDCKDPCPDNAVGSNTDGDNDGIVDCIDNCISVSNFDQYDADNNGIGDVCESPGCTDELACNYVSSATTNNGSCVFPDASKCEECIGTGAAGEVNQLGRCSCSSPIQYYDVLGECGGNCQLDLDKDGICDKRLGNDGTTLCTDSDSTGTCLGICWLDYDGNPCNQGDFNCENVCDLCVSALPEEFDDCGDCIGKDNNYTIWHDALGAPATALADAQSNTNVPCAIGQPGCFYTSSGSAQIDSGNYFYVWETTAGQGCIPGTAGCNANTSKPCDGSTEQDWCANLNGHCSCDTIADGTYPVLDECGVCNGTGPISEVYNCSGTCVNDSDEDGTCDENEITGCLDNTNCNYNPLAEINDTNQCLTEDVCGNCGGTMNFVDAGGSPCIITESSGVYIVPSGCVEASSGVCNCEGTPPAFARDCQGNCTLDSDNDTVCDDLEIDGCTDSTSCNYDSTATEDDGSCLTEDALGACGGDCFSDLDADGICDRKNDGQLIDDCVGAYDECAICNGSSQYLRSNASCEPGTFIDASGQECTPGTVGCLACTMSVTLIGADPIIPDFRDIVTGERCHPDSTGCEDANSYTAPVTVSDACNCSGNRYDALGVCGGTCTLDDDKNGICDHEQAEDVSACFGTLTADAVGNCGGNCATDDDHDGLCDDLQTDGTRLDPCLNDSKNELDACGICNGSYQFTAHGSTCVPGTFVSADGEICADINAFGCVSCTATLYMASDTLCHPIFQDAGGLPCTPGTAGCEASFDTECTAVTNCCDCLGLEADALGICGGDCQTDADHDGICDLRDDNSVDDTCIGFLVDDCGNCDGTYFFVNSSGDPCAQGSEGCTTADGKCNCNGDTLDALNICGGDCEADVDEDGVCDSRNGIVIDECLQLIDGTPCDPDTNTDCPQLDACGICGGTGPLPDCGCGPLTAGYCDCEFHREDECGICGGNGPLPYRNCDGLCHNPTVNTDGTVNHGLCQEEELLQIPAAVYYDPETGNQTILPFAVEDAVLQFQELHRRMATRLEWGSLSGHSKMLIVQDSIVSLGTLDVEGETVIGNDTKIEGHVVVDGSVTVKGDANILGTLFSNGGVESTTIDMGPGQTTIGGQTVADQNLSVSGTSVFHNNVDVYDRLTVATPGTPASNATMSVIPTTGDTYFGGQLDTRGGLQVDGNSSFQSGLIAESNSLIHEGQVSGILIATGDANFNANFDVGPEKMFVDSSNNVEVAGKMNIGKSLVVRKNLTLFGDADILGTTFARGGLRTKKLTLFGDMNVRGSGFLYGQVAVGGQSRFLQGINLGSDLIVHSGDAAIADVWTHEETNEICPSEYQDSDGNTCTPTFVLASDLSSPCPNATGGAGCMLNPSGNCYLVYNDTCKLTTKGALTDPVVFRVSNNTGLMTLSGGIQAHSFDSNSSFDGLTSRRLSVGGRLSAGGVSASVASVTVGTTANPSNSTISGTSTGNNINFSNSLTVSGNIGASLSNATFTGNGFNNLQIGNLSPSSAVAWTDIQATARPALWVQSGGDYVASFHQTSGGNEDGIKIQIGEKFPRRNNAFMQFTDDNNTVLGQISGLTWGERQADINYVAEAQGYRHHMDAVTSTFMHMKNTANLADWSWGAELTMAGAAALSMTGCVGFGAALCAPVISYIVAHGIAAGVATGSRYAAFRGRDEAQILLDRSKQVRTAWENNAGFDQAESKAPPWWNNLFGSMMRGLIGVPDDESNNTQVVASSPEDGSDYTDPNPPSSTTSVSSQDYSTGVVYRTGSADYAEWLPLRKGEKNLMAGQVIGVHEGFVSLQTNGADNIFVVSTNPAALGNMPESNNLENYVQAAFLGQVPVLVNGAVKSGDFIVASGNNDGLAVAVEPQSLETSQLKNIIGIAWASAENDDAVNKINVALGISDGVGNVVDELRSELAAVNEEIDGLMEMALAIAQGHEPSVLELQENGVLPMPILPEEMTFEPSNVKVKRRGLKLKKTARTEALTESTGNPQVAAFEYSPQLMEECFYRAMHLLRSNGVDIDNHPFWGQFKNNPAFRTEQIAQVITAINDHNDKAIRALSEFKDVSFGTPISRDEYLKLRKRKPRNASKNGYERFSRRTIEKFEKQLGISNENTDAILSGGTVKPGSPSGLLAEPSGASLNKR